MEFFRGGEAVLEQFGLLFPDSPISILVYNDKNLTPSLRRHVYYTSFLQKNAFLKRHFRKLLPAFPEIIWTLPVPDSSRLVLSTDAAVIKGVRLPEGAKHVCYCHSPPRYLWGMEEAYLESSSHSNWLGRVLFSAAMPRLRKYDWKMAQRVNRFIANSRCVQERILRCYGRESVVIHPPVSLDRFSATRPREDFYLVVSALVPYKFVRIAVDACTRLKRRLIVIGTGPEEADLKQRAGDNVTFLGWASNAVVQDHYERCRAFLFPGVEDFGITPCEAQASGAPVIAFGEGGVLETVQDEVSGLFFREQSTDALVAALKRFEDMPAFDPAVCRNNVTDLGPARFRSEMRDFLCTEFPEFFAHHPWPTDIGNFAPVSKTYQESIVPKLKLPRITPNAGGEAILPGSVGKSSCGLAVLEVVEPGNGGVFRHVEGLVRHLLANGVRVHLAYSDRRGSRSLIALAEQVRRAGGEVINLRVINVPELSDMVAVWTLWRLIHKLKPDIIHGHSSKAGVLARAAALFGFGHIVFYTPHAYYGMSREPKNKRMIYGWIESALARVGTTINISRDEAEFGRRSLKVPAARQRIIPNPVDTLHFRPATPLERTQARSHLNLQPDELVIGMVGRMCWQKDPETAYHAILQVAPSWPKLRFLHLGWGKWKDYLLGKVRDRGLESRVQILDYMEDPLVFYHGIDALLITSRYEAGWPFVVLEALACNLPIVGATCPGMKDLGTVGLSHVYPFSPENAEDCAQRIEIWLKQQADISNACNHRDYALQHFSLDHCFGSVLQTYRSRLAGKSRSSSLNQHRSA
jgi:glycosyltransferase involved in cell wall biosynthesis